MPVQRSLTAVVDAVAFVVDIEEWPGVHANMDVLQVADQVLFGHVLAIEWIRHNQAAVDADALGVLGQVVGLGQRGAAADQQEHLQADLVAAADPLLGHLLALVDGQGHAFAGPTVHKDAVHALGLQEVGIAVDDIVVDGAAPVEGIFLL